MILTDTHSHIYLPEFDADRDAVVRRASEAGVHRLLLPNIDSSTFALVTSCADSYPDKCYPMAGLHPTSVRREDYQEQLAFVEKCLNNTPNIIGIGEIGMDLYWDKTYAREQAEAFDAQVRLAVERQLPVAIHCREAFDEIMEILSPYRNDPHFKGVLHCFSGTASQAQTVLSFARLYIGVNGIATFKKSNLPPILAEFPIDRMVVETDCPYLAPTPFRGKRNESAYATYVLQKLADIRGISVEDIAPQIEMNVNNLFDKLNKC